MSKGSIWGRQSQELLRVFEDAGSSTKVLCVPLDYAKREHLALMCNGNGDILRRPFAVQNSPAGLDYLLEQVNRCCRHHRISPEHVFFGGEDPGSYAQNFVSTLRSGGWLVAGVNAHDAKEQRDTAQATTDRVDLTGIAKVLLSRRGNCSPAQSGAYRNLRTLVRHRRREVQMVTALRGRIHTVVDQLCPGFLDEQRSGISPFSESSLWLMEDRFSAAQIRRRRQPALIAALGRHGTPQPQRAAAKLKAHAASVLTAPHQHLITLQTSLAHSVRHYRCLCESIKQLERETAVWLAQTQGAFLTSVRGIGIVLAAGMTAEIGDPYTQGLVSTLCSYAGIIPRVYQTGGTQAEATTGSVAKRCNRILKDYTVQSANHIGIHGPDDLMADYKRRDANGQHADFGIGRRYLRMGMHLMRTSQVYLPPELRRPKTTPGERATYYLRTWPYLREKWHKTGALDVAFAHDKPLGQWRQMVQELYEIRLKL